MIMKRYLVTGGAGFIGSAVVRKLVRDTSHQVLVVDKLTYAGNLNSLAPVSNSPRYRFEQADIGDGERMRTLIDALPAGRHHASRRGEPCRSLDRRAGRVRADERGRHLRPAAGRLALLAAPVSRAPAGFRFHHVSTDEVFGSLGEDGLFHEEYPYQPTSPYSASKAASDHFVRAWHHTYGLPTIVTNCSNNYGPYHFPEKLIPLIILNALEGKPLPVYGKGENVRDWLFVEDHAAALILVADKRAAGETLQHRRPQRADQHRRRARDLRARR